MYFIHVPKTGGGTVLSLFGDRFVRQGNHRPARHVVPEGEPWAAFVRCPWDRYVSMFLHQKRTRSVTDLASLQWELAVYANTQAGVWMTPGSGDDKWSLRYLLCREDSDELWPNARLFRFEDYVHSVERLATMLGVETPPEPWPHKNPRRYSLAFPRMAIFTEELREKLDPHLEIDADLFGYEPPDLSFVPSG